MVKPYGPSKYKSEEILTFFVNTIYFFYISIMRIVCISDTHSLHNNMGYNLPEGDILIHAGDLSNKGGQKDVTNFIDWFSSLNYDTKIFIAGNHDFCFEKVNLPHHKGDYDWYHNIMNEENLSQSNITYLEDNFITIETPEFSRPIKIYGTPWQPWFWDWAFNLPRDGEELKAKYELIPIDTDILITHTPPWNIRDFVTRYGIYECVGCKLLRDRIDIVKPALNIFGHIHEAHGVAYIDQTMYVNASICTERYEPVNKPIIVDLTEVDGKIIANYVEQ